LGCAHSQLQFDGNRQSDARISAVVKVVPVVISDVQVIAIEPVLCPGFRPGIHQQERIAAVRKARISHVHRGKGVHPEPAVDSEIQVEAILRDIVTAVASTLSPGAMVALPLLRAILLPCTASLPGALLLPSPLLLPRDCLLLRALRLLLLGVLGLLLLRLLLGPLLLLLLGPLLLWLLLLLLLLGPLLLWLRLRPLLLWLLLGALLLWLLLLLLLLRPLLLWLLLRPLLLWLLLGALLLWLLLLLLLLRPLLLRLLLGPLLLLLLLLGPLLLRLLLLLLLLLLRPLLLWLLLGPLLLLWLLGGRCVLLCLRLLSCRLLCLRALLFFVLPVVLRVRRDKHPKNQNHGSGTGGSNDLHRNRLLKISIRRGAFLFLGFVGNVVDRLLTRCFGADNSHRRSLRWFVRRPEVGGSLRGGGDTPRAGIF